MAGSRQLAIDHNPTDGPEPWLEQMAVVILCRNETSTILETVASLPEGLGQWLVVDNGSSQECIALLQGAIPAANLLSVPKALGVGGAFLSGCRQLYPGIRWICKVDGDGQFGEVALLELLRVAVGSKTAMVKTARCNRQGWSLEPQRSPSRHWGNQVLTLLLALASGYYLMEDGTSGLFVIERRAMEIVEALGGLRSDHGFETTLLLSLGSLGANVLEVRVPVRYFPQRERTFSGRSLVKPLLWCLWKGAWRRLMRNHLVYRLSTGGLLLIAAGCMLGLGTGLTIFAFIKALSGGIPTTPGISAAATSLLGWGLIAGLCFVAYDLASTFRRFRCLTAFECWQPIDTHGIQATKTHQANRPS